MLKRLLMPLTLSATCALFLAGCGGSENTTTTNATNTTGAEKTTTTTTPSTTTTPTTTTTPATTTPASGDKIGVAECDDYLAKYETCLSKIPQAARSSYQTTFAQVRKQWRDAATNPQTKAALAAGCKAANDAAKNSMKTFGCEF